MYWPDDDKYYKATVTARKNKDTTIFTLTYDDGEVERVDLKTESFQILESGKPNLEQDAEPPPKKKRKIQEDSDEEEFEFEDEEMEDDEEEDGSDFEDDGPVEDEDEIEHWAVTDDEDDMPKKKKKITVTNLPPKTPLSKAAPLLPCRTPPTMSTQGASRSTGGSKTVTPNVTQHTPKANQLAGEALPFVEGAVNPAGSHIHNHLKFLRDPKDKQGRSSSHPDYESHTLKIDFHELNKLYKVSPAQQQWWEIKAQYFDTVLLFKTGKFYEMFHMDADIGVRVLNFVYMKGSQAHSGFPEVGYGKFSAMLVEAGYKVARVEQTETPEMLLARKKAKKAGTKTPQVMNREVCSILTAGTRTFCFMDDVEGLTDGGGQYACSVGPLLSIKEIPIQMQTAQEDDDDVQPVCEYGVTIIDAVRATVTVGQFADDVLRSRMSTLLTRFQPSEVSFPLTGLCSLPCTISQNIHLDSKHRFWLRVESMAPLALFSR